MRSKDRSFVAHPRLGRLPADWPVRKFCEVTQSVRDPVDVVARTTYREIGIRSHGKGIFHKEPIEGVALGDKRVFWAKPKCLTFNIVFAWEGAVAITSSAEAGMIGSHRFPMHEPHPEIDVEFLRRFFQTQLGIRLLGDASPGGAGRNRTLNQSLLAKTPVPVPPLPEQRRIAAILSAVDDVIEKTEGVIQQLQVVKNAMMQELLTRGLPGQHARFKNTQIGEIPKDWRVSRVAEVFEVQLGKMLSAAARNVGEQFPYLANRNVQWRTVRIDELETMGFSQEEQSKFSLRYGDVLVCEGGEVGRTAIWRGELTPCFYQKAIHRLRPRNASAVTSEFMLYLMQHAAGNNAFAHLTGKSSIAHLTKEKLETVLLALPSLNEQTEIARSLDALDTRTDGEKGAMCHLRLLRSALMSVLLSGELRVIAADTEAA